jgi:hypothetical protein
MPVIDLKFTDQPVLHLSIDNTELGQKYFNLIQDNYKTQSPIFRDQLKYTVEYMHTLAIEANEKLGWNWQADTYTIANTALLHKNIEELLGTVGFRNVPAEYDNLLHELHNCLHQIQDNKKHKTRSGWLQIEWYNDEGFPLDSDFKFTSQLNEGDLKLQNPWVGHGPLQIFSEKDFNKISQTCKFHNFVKPGINLLLDNFTPFTEFDKLIKIFKDADPDFVNKHGEEKIRKYTGYLVVGKVLNINDLRIIKYADKLNFEYLKFYE